MDLLDQLEAHAAARPNALAVADERDALTWAALAAAVRRLHIELADALPAGSVLLLCGGNEVRMMVAWLAGLAAGLRVLAVSPDLAPGELRATAERSGAAYAIVDPGRIEAVRAVTPRRMRLDEIALPSDAPSPVVARDRSADGELWLLSSGTTAEPKIVCRTTASLDAVARAVAEAVQLSPADRVLLCVPLCHSYGMEHGILGPIIAGSTVILQQGFDTGRMLNAMDRAQVTVLPGVPVMFEALSELPAGGEQDAIMDHVRPRLRAAYSAGAPLPASVSEALGTRWALRIGQVYGATEMGSVTFNAPWDADFDPGSVGRPLRGMTIRILDPDTPDAPDAPAAPPQPPGVEGQVAVAGPSLMRAYANGEQPPLHDGALLTGDLGLLDASGRLHLTGRTRLLIDIGGRKVNPLEVEAVLKQHAMISEAVVLPLSVSATVHRLRAIVCPARDASGSPMELDLAKVRAFLRERLASYKLPRVIDVVESLPRTPAGKVDRAKVREQSAPKGAS